MPNSGSILNYKKTTKFFTFMAVSCLILSCSGTPQDLVSKDSSLEISKNFNSGYQEIYRNIVNMSRKCRDGHITTALNPATATFINDADLYSDLGYGEISNRMSYFGTNNFYYHIKVERVQEGTSKVTAWVGNTLAKENLAKSIFHWASGGETCSAP